MDEAIDAGMMGVATLTLATAEAVGAKAVHPGPAVLSVLPWRCAWPCIGVGCHMPYTVTPSHAGLASGEAGLVAAQAKQLKNRKYAVTCQPSLHPMQLPLRPVRRVFGTEAAAFFKDLYNY